MEQEKQTRAGGDPEKTLVAPRFDDEARDRARPAVPLKEPHTAAPFRLMPAMADLTSGRWLLALILIIMLVSGVVGGLTSALYQRHLMSKQAASEPSPVSGTDTPQVNDSPADSTAPSISGDDSLEKGDATRRQQPPSVNATTKPAPFNVEGDEETGPLPQQGDEMGRASLQAALGEWIATTNARDINRQRDFYMPKVNAFYRARNVSRDVVLADKGRAFENFDLIDVRAARPDINIHPGGRTATMRFRKQYQIKGKQQERRGEVVQELKWRRTGKGWKIMSERDLKVIH
jgi:ketosteroid isomerase-like protein